MMIRVCLKTWCPKSLGCLMIRFPMNMWPYTGVYTSFSDTVSPIGAIGVSNFVQLYFWFNWNIPYKWEVYIRISYRIATDMYLEHALKKCKPSQRDVLSIGVGKKVVIEHTQNLYLEHFQAILRTSQWGTNGNHTYMYVRSTVQVRQ